MFVYGIRNKLNEKIYIGKWEGIRVETRWRNHQQKLNKQIHENSHLQRAWNKYSSDNWEFFCLEQCSSKNELKELEIRWISHFKSNLPDFGYNKTLGGDGSTGFKHSEESKDLMRQARLGKKYVMSNEQKQNISRGLTGRKKSENHIRNHALSVRTYADNRLISPDGMVMTVEPTLTHFCRTHNLDPSGISKLLRGLKRKDHGWKRYREAEGLV